MEKTVKERLVLYLNSKGIGYNKFEKMAGLSNAYISNLKKAPGANILNKILKAAPDLNREWLLTGEGEMYNEDIQLAEDLRPRYDLAAFAGTLSEYVDDTCEMTRKITQLPKYDFTIRITGDSMEPEYKSGDEVACMRVEKGDFVQWGKVYVLNTSQGAVIKRLFKGENGYRCVSDNKMYNDFEVKESDVYSINLVVGLLRIC